jgi:hypothetical protein
MMINSEKQQTILEEKRLQVEEKKIRKSHEIIGGS